MNYNKKTTVAFARGWNNLSISRSRPKGVVFSCDLRKVYHNTEDLSTNVLLSAGKYGKGVGVSGSTGSDVSVPDFGY